ncbi:DUF3515 family protein [Kytococcus sedentarius]|uniref:DUF3515 family protein n=1 Tax=Kytococcus sedentarius TaxID=1276 RepID=UPI00387974EA
MPSSRPVAPLQTPSTRRPLVRCGAAALALTAVLAGCSRGEVAISPAPLAGEPVCQEVAEAFPETVAGRVAQPVPEEAAGSAAAWGNPPIVARCGVVPPGPTTDPCLTVNKVDWVVQELDDGIALVTYGRTPALEILVPASYPQSADLVAGFAEAAGTLPSTGRACT